MQYCFESVFVCFFVLFLYLVIGIVVVNGCSMDNLGAILIMMFFAIIFCKIKKVFVKIYLIINNELIN